MGVNSKLWVIVKQPLLLLMGVLFVLSLSACSDIIKIESIKTVTPTVVTLSEPSSWRPINTDIGMPPTRIVSEKIGLDSTVVEMGWRVEDWGGQATSVWNIPENEAGWHINSARLGQKSNVVISGHNNSIGGHVFGQLNSLDVGDKITLWAGDSSSQIYQISDRKIVRMIAASSETLAYLQAVISPTDREQLTLITCWPSWSNTHRLVIIAHPL